MNLHEQLRDLVARQGPDVVESAESFRGALDDFLTEDEATTGELNLLVDAVRLGAVHRLLSMIDHGAEPVAAVREAGEVFARDRGTDDVARCRWAVAVVGFALGRVGEGVVVTSAAPSVPAPPTLRPAAPPPRPPGPRTEQPPATFPATEAVAGTPGTAVDTAPVVGPPRRAARRRTGTVVLAGLLVAAVVVGAVLAGMWLGNRDDSPKGASDGSKEPGSASAGDEASGGEADDAGGSSEAAIPTGSLVVPLTDENDETRIYVVDVETGDSEPITDGPDDRVAGDLTGPDEGGLPRGPPGKRPSADAARHGLRRDASAAQRPHRAPVSTPPGRRSTRPATGWRWPASTSSTTTRAPTSSTSTGRSRTASRSRGNHSAPRRGCR